MANVMLCLRLNGIWKYVACPLTLFVLLTLPGIYVLRCVHSVLLCSSVVDTHQRLDNISSLSVGCDVVISQQLTTLSNPTYHRFNQIYNASTRSHR